MKNKDIVLSVNHIGKAYKYYDTEWKRVLSWFGMKCQPREEQWTLKDIHFSLTQGEAVGIIGQNGAGKSTILKIITGTLKPTLGNIYFKGKIAAILELGMGFHPDMTGRQNAYHSAGLMGYTSKQIDDVIDDIEKFAEIKEYFDMPVRLYSSGMQVRVAFSVATAFRPEILIIDEALSVGDMYFQHKSFDRIRQFRECGTSLIFVSHDKSSILSLCDRVILLDKGMIIKDGNPEEVTDLYNALIAEKENMHLEQRLLDNGKVQTISGTQEVSIDEVYLTNMKNESVECINVGEKVCLTVKVCVRQSIPSLVLGYSLKDRTGQVVFGTNTWHTKQVIESPKVNSSFEYKIYFDANFGVGSYSVQLALVDQATHLTRNYEWRDLALMFDIINNDKPFFIGLSWAQPIIEIKNNE